MTNKRRYTKTKGTSKRKPVDVDVNFILAGGIVAQTTDDMILDGSAIEGWRAALSLVGWGNRRATKYRAEAWQDFIKECIRPRVTAFEERYPDFPSVKFIDDVFEEERIFGGKRLSVEEKKKRAKAVEVYRQKAAAELTRRILTKLANDPKFMADPNIPSDIKAVLWRMVSPKRLEPFMGPENKTIQCGPNEARGPAEELALFLCVPIL